MQQKIIIGIDLAGASKNPTGLAVWENKKLSACQLYADEEIVQTTLMHLDQIRNRRSHCHSHWVLLQGKTELVGNEKEGYIAVPVKRAIGGDFNCE